MSAASRVRAPVAAHDCVDNTNKLNVFVHACVCACGAVHGNDGPHAGVRLRELGRRGGANGCRGESVSARLGALRACCALPAHSRGSCSARVCVCARTTTTHAIMRPQSPSSVHCRRGASCLKTAQPVFEGGGWAERRGYGTPVPPRLWQRCTPAGRTKWRRCRTPWAVSFHLCVLCALVVNLYLVCHPNYSCTNCTVCARTRTRARSEAAPTTIVSTTRRTPRPQCQASVASHPPQPVHSQSCASAGTRRYVSGGPTLPTLSQARTRAHAP